MNGQHQESQAQGAYSVTYMTCRVCGADRPKLLGTRGNLEYSGARALPPGEPHRVTNVVQCRVCSFVYTNPRILLSEADQQQQYQHADEYVPYANDPSKGLDRILMRIERLMPQKGRLLDIGAGKGEFLAAAKRRGWDAHGIEPSAEFVQYARDSHHLSLSHVAMEDTDLPEGSADVVTLNMVLEHVDDPHALLGLANRVLRPGGLLLIEVPNLDSLMLKGVRLYFRLTQRDWSPLLSPLHWPYHCYGYPLRTIKFLCARHGFDIIRAHTSDLQSRGFRENPGISTREASLRDAAMRIGGLVGSGDVLMVYGRKTAQPTVPAGARMSVQ